MNLLCKSDDFSEKKEYNGICKESIFIYFDKEDIR